MSIYKLIEVVKTSEKETQSIYDRDDLTIALADMHNDFGVAVKDSTTVATYCVLINNETGARIDGLYFSSESIVGEETINPLIKERVYTHNSYSDDNITAYDSTRLAIGNYNTKVASALKKEECTYAITIRFNDIGEYADFDFWTRPIEQSTT